MQVANIARQTEDLLTGEAQELLRQGEDRLAAARAEKLPGDILPITQESAGAVSLEPLLGTASDPVITLDVIREPGTSGRVLVDAILALRNYEVDRARDLLKSALSSTPAEEPEAQLAILDAFVELDELTGDLRAAYAWAERGLSLARTLNRTEVSIRYTASLLWSQAYIQHSLGKSGTAQNTLNQAIRLIDKKSGPGLAGWPPRASLIRLRAGVQTALGHWEAADNDLADALRQAVNLHETSIEAVIYGDFSFLRTRQGLLTDALHYCTNGFRLKLKEQLGLRSLAYCYTYLAEIFLSTPGHSRINRLLLVNSIYRALRFFEEAHDLRNRSYVETLICRVYNVFGEVEPALYHGLRGLQFGTQLELPLHQAVAHRELASAYTAQGHLQAAREQLSRSLALLDELDDPFELACSHRDLGRVLHKLAKHDTSLGGTARHELESAREIFGQLGAEHELLATEAKLRATDATPSVERKLRKEVNRTKESQFKYSNSNIEADGQTVKSYRIAKEVANLLSASREPDSPLGEPVDLVGVKFVKRHAADGEAVLYFADDFMSTDESEEVHYIRPRTKTILDGLGIKYVLINS